MPLVTHKESGTSWPFWTKLLDVRTGDMVLHLRGRQHASFVGFSRAISDGKETSERPPDPGPYSYAKSFYRVDLDDFTPFHTPIPLSDVFSFELESLPSF